MFMVHYQALPLQGFTQFIW